MVKVEQHARQHRNAHARSRKVQEPRGGTRTGPPGKSADKGPHEAQIDAENRRLRDAEEGGHGRGDIKCTLFRIVCTCTTVVNR